MTALGLFLSLVFAFYFAKFVCVWLIHLITHLGSATGIPHLWLMEPRGDASEFLDFLHPGHPHLRDQPGACCPGAFILSPRAPAVAGGRASRDLLGQAFPSWSELWNPLGLLSLM